MKKLTSNDLNHLRKEGWIVDVNSTEIPLTISTGEILISEKFQVESFQDESYSSKITRLRFEGVEILGKFNVKNSTKEDYYIFSNCIFHNAQDFKGVGHLIRFENKTYFKETVHLSLPGDSISHISIENIEFDNDLIIFSRVEHFLIVNNINRSKETKIGHLLFFAKLANLQLFEINVNSILIGDLRKFSMWESFISTGAEIIAVRCNLLSIRDSTFQGGLLIYGSDVGALQIERIGEPLTELGINKNCQIENLELTLGNFTITRIAHSYFKNIKLIGKNNTAQSLNIEYCSINEMLEFEEIENVGAITLNQLDMLDTASIQILNSDLGKAKIFNCDFNSTKLEFRNSLVSDIFMVKTNFPKKINLQGKELKPNYVQAQLFFGQLHTACKKQGDTVGELVYQSQEIEAHYKNISWGTNFWTKLNLWLSWVSNRFGQSWSRGILFTFCVSIITFYIIVAFCSKEYTVGWHFYFDRFIPAFFKFMNPVRFFELESIFTANGNKPLTLSYPSYIIDFFSRILLAYGYYQTIQAFRRFGRK